MKKAVEAVTELLKPILKQKDFKLDEIELDKEGGKWYLRIYIDKPNGITMEDCVEVNNQLSEKLDNLDPDPLPDPYMLEVSSPGAERPLKDESDLKKALGEFVHISLYKKINNKKMYEGTLLEVDKDNLTLKWNNKGQFKKLEIPREDIAKIRLAIKF